MKRLLSIALLSVLTVAASADAQSLGTYRWQIRPYNIVHTVNVTQEGGVYVLHGYEQVCGSTNKRPLYGIAIPQPSGFIQFGYTIVNSDASGWQQRSLISPSSLSGSWIDDALNSGTFIFNPPGMTCDEQGHDASGIAEATPRDKRRSAPAWVDGATLMRELAAEVDILRKRLAAVEGKK